MNCTISGGSNIPRRATNPAAVRTPNTTNVRPQGECSRHHKCSLHTRTRLHAQPPVVWKNGSVRITNGNVTLKEILEWSHLRSPLKLGLCRDALCVSLR